MSHPVKISELKFNPDNPRTIQDSKFKKLVKSIQEFPRMLELRPIIVNAEGMVLGGNMRLKAAIAAGLDSVYVIQALHLTKDQEKEFIIKDNLSYGSWNYDSFNSGWELKLLTQWGMDLPTSLKTEIKPVEIEEEYRVIVSCSFEEEQLKLLEEFKERGFECRIL